VIYVCQHHDEVLAHWREQDRREIALAHVDFHDDLRGLLIDRRRGVAYPIGRLVRGLAPLDAGNFLAHAVLERRLAGIRWVHGRVGGRAWDAGIVRYESDLFATHHRLRHRLRGEAEYPLEFEEVLLDRWSGPRPGELLSIDWDCFASILLDAENVGARVDAFLERLGAVVPPDTYLAFSPEYSHPGLETFRDLAARLGRRFAQPIEWLSAGLAEGRVEATDVCAAPPTGPLMRLVLFLRRRGIY
jgi:hypothetical protein